MNRAKSLIFTLILLVWLPFFMAAWDKDKPSSSTSLRSSNPEILANQSALETAIGQDHEFSTGGSNTGEHTQIKFNAPISTPTNAANKGWVYSKDVNVVELHWLDESGNELQMTSGGDLFSSAGLTVTGESTFNNHMNLGAGDDLIGSSTSDIIFNTDKFTVSGADGNTAVAGTLDVNGVATLGDGSLLATSAAPSTDAMVANKKYVDVRTSGDIVTVNDSEANAMLKAHAYRTQTAGFVTAYIQNNQNALTGYVHTTNNPAGAGTLMAQSTTVGNAANDIAISFFVGFESATGIFFEITAVGTPTITWTPLIAGGAAPIDQD